MSFELIEQFVIAVSFFCIGLAIAVSLYQWGLLCMHQVSRRREQPAEANANFELILHSRYTIPISAVVYGGGSWSRVRQSVRSLLAQVYQQSEIIVMNPSRESEFVQSALYEEFEFKPVSLYFCRVIPTKEPRCMYRSRKFPHLTVILHSGSNLDGLNFGMNAARYRYVLPIQAGTRLKANTMIKLIRPALVDPQKVIAVFARIRTVTKSATADGLSWLQLVSDVSQTLKNRFTRFGAANQLPLNRCFQQHLIGDELVLWRKDLIKYLGGFAEEGLCDFLLRVEHHFARLNIPFASHTIEEVLGEFEVEQTRTTWVNNIRHRFVRGHAALKKHHHLLWQEAPSAKLRRRLKRVWFELFAQPWLEWAGLACILAGSMLGMIPTASVWLYMLLVWGHRWCLYLATVVLDQWDQRQSQVTNHWAWRTIVGSILSIGVAFASRIICLTPATRDPFTHPTKQLAAATKSAS